MDKAVLIVVGGYAAIAAIHLVLAASHSFGF